MYRRIAVLSAHFRTSVSPLLVPVMSMVTCIAAIYCLFGAIRFGEKISLHVYALFPMCSILFYLMITIISSFMSRLYCYSIELNRNCYTLQFASNLGTHVFRKTVKSLQPITFPIGVYYVDRAAMLNMIYLLVDRTIQLLVGIPP